jgi:DNA transformation protein
MARDTSFRDYVLDQLAGLPDVRCRAMFGGFGLYSGETFFAVIASGRLYLKTDEKTRPDFVEQGMAPFRPSERQTLSSYYEVPVDVLEDADALVEWSRRAVVAAKG